MDPDHLVLERIWPPATAPAGWLSHLGGWPNLPADMAWPRIALPDGTSAALDFLAQIDLACLPDTPERGVLPAEGTLYFFAVSQTPLPFEEIGKGGHRVLYHPAGAAGIPPRAPPADAGWGLEDMDYARTPAADFRDPDAPRGALHPYCPVRAKPAPLADPDEPRPFSYACYRNQDLPLRVEDALLHLNFARNTWRENIMPFEAYLDHLRARARSSRAYAARKPPRPDGKPTLPAPWVYYVLSEDGLNEFSRLYDDWRTRTIACARELASLGRSAVLPDTARKNVMALVAEASALHRKVSHAAPCPPSPADVAKLSLATLLLHDPGLAEKIPEEVAAADPSLTVHDRPHRMFGRGRAVQKGTMTGPDPILLLQVESDDLGPRFMWWDAGNLTFWISRQDAAVRRFDRVLAQIEGH